MLQILFELNPSVNVLSFTELPENRSVEIARLVERNRMMRELESGD